MIYGPTAPISAKAYSSFLCGWSDNKIHSYLLLQQRTVTEATHIDREDAISTHAQAELPSADGRLASWVKGSSDLRWLHPDFPNITPSKR